MWSERETYTEKHERNFNGFKAERKVLAINSFGLLNDLYCIYLSKDALIEIVICHHYGFGGFLVFALEGKPIKMGKGDILASENGTSQDELTSHNLIEMV